MKSVFYSFCIIILLVSGCSNQYVDEGKMWIYDFEDVLTESQEDTLNNIISQFERETTNEIAIVTTPDIGKHDKMVLYAVEFGEHFGIGKAEKHNGLIIVFSAKLRQTFLATGNGTENILTDPICQEIVDQRMLPKFRENQYYLGIKEGLMECIRIWKR